MIRATTNADVRDFASQKRVFLFEVSDALGISNSTLMGWLRRELPEDRKKLIIATIDELAARR